VRWISSNGKRMKERFREKMKRLWIWDCEKIKTRVRVRKARKVREVLKNEIRLYKSHIRQWQTKIVKSWLERKGKIRRYISPRKILLNASWVRKEKRRGEKGVTLMSSGKNGKNERHYKRAILKRKIRGNTLNQWSKEAWIMINTIWVRINDVRDLIYNKNETITCHLSLIKIIK